MPPTLDTGTAKLGNANIIDLGPYPTSGIPERAVFEKSKRDIQVVLQIWAVDRNISDRHFLPTERVGLGFPGQVYMRKNVNSYLISIIM